MKSRITLEMTPRDAVVAMCDGNPGAINVMMSLLLRGEAIDPDGMVGGIGPILMLDTFQVYGSRIWILFKDVCRGDLVSTVAVLRACQLGMVSRDVLSRAINNRGDGIDVPGLLAKVRGRLPKFGQPEKAAEQDRAEEGAA